MKLMTWLKFKEHRQWLLQPSMYHYRRAIFAARNKKQHLRQLMRATQAYFGLPEPRYCLGQYEKRWYEP